MVEWQIGRERVCGRGEPIVQWEAAASNYAGAGAVAGRGLQIVTWMSSNMAAYARPRSDFVWVHDSERWMRKCDGSR